MAEHAGRSPVARAAAWRGGHGLALAALLLLGVLLRLWLLTHRPWLWLDEAHLVPNVVDRGWAALFTPAINDQMAPFGFLALVKASTGLFGDTEWPLRLPAFVAGLGCLALLPVLARALGLDRVQTLAMVAVGAVLPAWIYYSAEFKQYAFELLLCIATMIAAARALDRGTFAARLPLCLIGIVAVWFALSAPLFLGAIGGYVLVRDLIARRWRLLVPTAIAAILWLALFGLHYRLLLDPDTAGRMTGRFWVFAMAPRSAQFPFWALERQSALFAFLAASTVISWSLALLALLGAFTLAAGPDRHAVWLCVLPLAAAFVAACLHLYPYDSRLLLFASAGPVVLVACGAVALARLRGPAGLRFGLAACGVVLFGQLAVAGASQAARWHDDPFPAAIDYVAHHRRPGDTVYVHALGLPEWRYYARRYPTLAAAAGPIVYGRDARHEIGYLMEDMERLFGRHRVWLVMARGRGASFLQDGVRDQALMDYVASLRGTVRDRFRREGSAAVLVDFNGDPAPDLAPPGLPPYRPSHASYRPTAQ